MKANCRSLFRRRFFAKDDGDVIEHHFNLMVGAGLSSVGR